MKKKPNSLSMSRTWYGYSPLIIFPFFSITHMHTHTHTQTQTYRILCEFHQKRSNDIFCRLFSFFWFSMLFSKWCWMWIFDGLKVSISILKGINLFQDEKNLMRKFHFHLKQSHQRCSFDWLLTNVCLRISIQFSSIRIIIFFEFEVYSFFFFLKI